MNKLVYGVEVLDLNKALVEKDKVNKALARNRDALVAQHEKETKRVKKLKEKLMKLQKKNGEKEALVQKNKIEELEDKLDK